MESSQVVVVLFSVILFTNAASPDIVDPHYNTVHYDMVLHLMWH